ncbi:lipopolysaccharide biosynthesis protein [Sinomicrobium soli]|nr:lipopolysaccharide biosynthesis protein [Sinomicrobium sp. N-1-3-6]
MFLTMGVTLYTSRVVLNTLGVSDYGAYSVIGGVVATFGFFKMAMASATQRFLSFEIGTGNLTKLKQTFCATVNIHIGIAVLILLLAETVGLWFVNHKLNIDHERMEAVNWVYQFSILSFMVSVMQVPYNALIIARERMNIYAAYSIIEVLLKLMIVYLLVVSPFDKLKTYAVLMFGVTVLVALMYRIYCIRHFMESKYRFYYDADLYKILMSYSGWSLFGNIAAVARVQGSNIILNLFFGTTINAAYGITSQVNSATKLFVSNFQVALNPQIIKSYAQKDLIQNHKLIFQGSKLSFFLLFLIVCPIWFNIDFILKVWLKNPPEYTSIFVRLALVNLLVDCISGPLMIGIQATGKIKWYQVVVGLFILSDLPITYLAIKVYNEPILSYIVTITITFLSLTLRLYFLKKGVFINILSFFKQVLLKIVLVVFVCGFFGIYGASLFIPYEGWIKLIVSSVFITILNMLVIILIGLSKSELNFFKKLIVNKIIK